MPHSSISQWTSSSLPLVTAAVSRLQPLYIQEILDVIRIAVPMWKGGQINIVRYTQLSQWSGNTWMYTYSIIACKHSTPINEVRASQLAQASETVGSLIPASQQGWNPCRRFRPDALVFFRTKIYALKKTRASGRNVGKVFNPVVKLVLENQPFLSQAIAGKFTASHPLPHTFPGSGAGKNTMH